ncbi:MAG TPA: asparagine synthetase B, partial [Candidatus Limnocylindria bacterium]|nr:asparagine synthetase B [Candidatus Limnocylindria bacterium]
MCGIAGVVDFQGRPASGSLLRHMIGQLRHRGPDGMGLHTDGPVGIAHARLSIIDAAGGQQPMANADGTLWITFNGEIFNYVELREALEARGRRFATRSDTEV